MNTAADPLAQYDPLATDQRGRSALKNLLALGESTQLLLLDLADLAAGPDASPALKAMAVRGTKLLQQRRLALANLARHESEAEQRRERLLQITTAATHSLDLQSFIDPGYVYRYVNDRYLAYWACRRDQIEGHTMAELIGQDTFEHRVKPMIDKAFAGEHVSWETSVDYPGRDRRHIRATFLPACCWKTPLHSSTTAHGATCASSPRAASACAACWTACWTTCAWKDWHCSASRWRWPG